MELLKNILLVARQYREFRAALAELNGRPERELALRGIGRGDIARVAYETAERRVTVPADSAPAWPNGALAGAR